MEPSVSMNTWIIMFVKAYFGFPYSYCEVVNLQVQWCFVPRTDKRSSKYAHYPSKSSPSIGSMGFRGKKVSHSSFVFQFAVGLAFRCTLGHGI